MVVFLHVYVAAATIRAKVGASVRCQGKHFRRLQSNFFFFLVTVVRNIGFKPEE